MLAVKCFLAFLFVLLTISYVDADCRVGGNVAQDCLYNVTSLADYIFLSTNRNWRPPAGGTGVVTVGPASKILHDMRDWPNSCTAYFANGATYPSHGNIVSALGLDAAYNACPLVCNNQAMFGCNQAQPYGFFRCDWQLYVDVDGSILTAITINANCGVSSAAMAALAQCTAPFVRTMMQSGVRFGYVATDMTPDHQYQKYDAATKQIYESLGMELWYLSDLQSRGANAFFNPLHTGEGYGRLVLFPDVIDLTATALLRPTDIVVFNQLPLTLSVVSGVITTVFQTVNSHVNLKSNERDTPNMVLLNYDSFKSCFQALNNTNVHLAVALDGWVIEPATQEQVDTFRNQTLAAKRWVPLYHDIGGDVVSFNKMCNSTNPEVCLRKRTMYGTKAAGLGFFRQNSILGVTTKKESLSWRMGYDLSPVGFAVPFQYYVDFIQYPPNKGLYEKIVALNQRHLDLNGEVEPLENLILCTEIQQLFYNGTYPPENLKKVMEMADDIFDPLNIKDIKVRSSSNAEDLPAFDGAGLYDSYSANVGQVSTKPCMVDPVKDDVNDQSLECAMKAVYASLFNQRGVYERAHARFRHDSTAMGLAIVAAYHEVGMITANGVVITRNVLSPDRLGYSYSMQEGEDTVTNPPPGTIAEASTVTFSPSLNYSWTLNQGAKPDPNAPPKSDYVLPPPMLEDMLSVTRAIERAYCKYYFNQPNTTCNTVEYNNAKIALDMELKIFGDRRIHVKQVRQFTGLTSKTVRLPSRSNWTCQSIAPGYFAPPESVTMLNAALKKPVTCTGLPNNGAYTFSPSAAQAVDGVSDISATTTVQATQCTVDLELPHVIKYLRVVGPRNNQAQMASFDITLMNAAGGVITTVPYRSTTGAFVMPVQTLNVSVNGVSRIRLSNAGGTVYFTELQAWGPPAYVGNPADFPVEPRPNPPDCVWGAWTPYSACVPPTPSACGQGVGVQTRSRPSTACLNYYMWPDTEKMPCDVPCPASPTPSPLPASSPSPSSPSPTTGDTSELNAASAEELQAWKIATIVLISLIGTALISVGIFFLVRRVFQSSKRDYFEFGSKEFGDRPSRF